MNQCEAILGHIRQQPITAIAALNEHQCFRLAARIKDLREAGHVIDARMIEVESGKRVAEYRLVKEAAA